jgi:hypothetical protein
MRTQVSRWTALKIQCPECKACWFIHTAGGDLRTIEQRVKVFLDVTHGKEVKTECPNCNCEHELSLSRIS